MTFLCKKLLFKKNIFMCTYIQNQQLTDNSAISNFHLRSHMMEESKIAKLCINKDLPNH